MLQCFANTGFMSEHSLVLFSKMGSAGLHCLGITLGLGWTSSKCQDINDFV